MVWVRVMEGGREAGFVLKTVTEEDPTVTISLTGGGSKNDDTNGVDGPMVMDVGNVGEQGDDQTNREEEELCPVAW